jgi:hypothetical protein
MAKHRKNLGKGSKNAVNSLDKLGEFLAENGVKPAESAELQLAIPPSPIDLNINAPDADSIAGDSAPATAPDGEQAALGSPLTDRNGGVTEEELGTCANEDPELFKVLVELEAKRRVKVPGEKPWTVMTYDGVLRIVRYAYVKKARRDDGGVSPSLFIYQARYSLNGISSTQNLGRSDQISFSDAYTRAKEFRKGVQSKRENLQINKPLIARHKRKERSERIGKTFESIEDALMFLRILHLEKTSYFSIYWQIATLLPTLGPYIDRLRWQDFDLERNKLRIYPLGFQASDPVLEIEISDRITSLISKWKQYDFHSLDGVVFDSYGESVKTPRRKKILHENLGQIWQKYPLAASEIGMFWKRELRKTSKLSSGFLDRAFNSLLSGVFPKADDAMFVDYIHQSWWEYVDADLHLAYKRTWKTVKPAEDSICAGNSLQSSLSAGVIVPRRKSDSIGYSIKDLASHDEFGDYNFTDMDRVTLSSNDLGFTVDPKLNAWKNTKRQWKAKGKIPLYSPNLKILNADKNYVALMLASDFNDPKFCIEGKPAIFLVNAGVISKPEYLIDSGIEIEFCDKESITTVLPTNPSTFLQKIPLRLIPFVSSRLAETVLVGNMYLYRACEAGSTPGLMVNAIYTE